MENRTKGEWGRETDIVLQQVYVAKAANKDVFEDSPNIRIMQIAQLNPSDQILLYIKLYLDLNNIL